MNQEPQSYKISQLAHRFLLNRKGDVISHI